MEQMMIVQSLQELQELIRTLDNGKMLLIDFETPETEDEDNGWDY